MNSPISKPMNIILWILQAILALLFLGHAWIMLNPPPELVEIMNASMPSWLRIFIGIAEVLGPLGLILPGITRMKPQLTVWAAMGLAIIVGLATIVHLTRGEVSSALTTVVLCLACSFVAYMRQKESPIIAKQQVANASNLS